MAAAIRHTRCEQARARARGNVLGRPKIHNLTEEVIREALKSGNMGIRKIAMLHNVGTGTVQRIKGELADAQPNLTR